MDQFDINLRATRLRALLIGLLMALVLDLGTAAPAVLAAITCPGGICVGTAGDDTFQGTAGVDVIDGNGGAECSMASVATISSSADFLDGRHDPALDGPDRIYGGGGADGLDGIRWRRPAGRGIGQRLDRRAGRYRQPAWHGHHPGRPRQRHHLRPRRRQGQDRLRAWQGLRLFRRGARHRDQLREQGPGVAGVTTDPKQRKERLVKRSELRTRTALIVMAALVLGGGLLESVTQPAAAVVPGANGRIVFSSNRDGDHEIYTMGPEGSWASAARKPGS